MGQGAIELATSAQPTPTQPGPERTGGTINQSIAVSDTLQQRLPSARHMGAGILSPITPSARGLIRPAGPDRSRVR